MKYRVRSQLPLPFLEKGTVLNDQGRDSGVASVKTGILCIGCHDVDVQSLVGSQYLVRCTAPARLSTIESGQDKGTVQGRLPCTR